MKFTIVHNYQEDLKSIYVLKILVLPRKRYIHHKSVISEEYPQKISLQTDMMVKFRCFAIQYIHISVE